MYCTDRICAAFALAALVHENQKRKSTEIPYISHPMAVWNWDVGAEFRISIKKPELRGLRP